MAMDSSSWVSLLDHDLLWCQQQADLQHADSLLWSQQQQQHSLSSVENDSSKGDSMNLDKSCSENLDKSCSKKRARDECSSGAGAKACREKMRRDRLNDRFMELSAVLEPDKPPKTDKASILRDAARILSQLRVETQHLKDANCQLLETIKELKAEKNELRDEKLTLKSEKERLEKHIKSANVVPNYMSHPSTVHTAAVVAYSSPNDPHSKLTSFREIPFTMSQWMPPATVDISNDHVLRPPVA